MSTRRLIELHLSCWGTKVEVLYPKSPRCKTAHANQTRAQSGAILLAASNLRFFSPQLVEETALGHFFEEAPVDEFFGLDFLSPGISLRDVI